jgi:hypothetical protein
MATAVEGAEGAIQEVYARANRLNAQLASGTSDELIREAREVARQLTEHVKGRVERYEDFVERVASSEEFSLTESRQVAKEERELKVLYLRATSLLEAANEAEERGRRKRR